jgi:hypothetical protein
MKPHNFNALLRKCFCHASLTQALLSRLFKLVLYSRGVGGVVGSSYRQAASSEEPCRRRYQAAVNGGQGRWPGQRGRAQWRPAGHLEVLRPRSTRHQDVRYLAVVFACALLDCGIRSRLCGSER